MPLPVIPDTWRVALDWSDGLGQTATNVMHFVSASAADNGDIFAQIDSHVTAGMWKNCGDGTAVATVTITKLDGTTATDVFNTGEPAKWTGGTSGDFIPNVAQIVSFKTGLRGRAFRGRIYLPFTAEGSTGKGVVTANLSTVQAAWDTFKADMDGDSTFLSVASYDRAHGGAGAQANGVTVITYEQKLATQRRRQSRLR